MEPEKMHRDVLVVGTRYPKSDDGEVHWYEFIDSAVSSVVGHVQMGHEVCILRLTLPVPMTASDITTLIEADKSKWLPTKTGPLKPFVEVTFQDKGQRTVYTFDTIAECTSFVQGFRAANSGGSSVTPLVKVWPMPSKE